LRAILKPHIRKTGSFLVVMSRETLNKSNPFGLSLSKPLIPWAMPFDKLRANGIAQGFPKECEAPKAAACELGSQRE
jgi:hypothetical protein